MDQNRLAAIKDLRTEALQDFEAALVAEFVEIRSVELSVDSVREMTEISNAIKAVRAELSSRPSTEEPAPAGPSDAELAAQADAAAAAIELSEALEETVEEEPAEAEVVVEAEPVEVQAATTEIVELSTEGLESNLDDVTKRPASITAGADIPGTTAGSPLTNMRAVAEAFTRRRTALRGSDRSGDGDNVIVASIAADYPEERTLFSGDIVGNMEKIQAVAEEAALTASGGLCAPLEPYYGIQVISAAHRPVRDALPKFAADRGGVRFQPPPKLTDLNGAIGNTTSAADALTYPSPTPYKPCLHVTCGNEQSVTVQAVHRCLTFGNFAARTYPEQVEAWLALSVAAHARRAETLLLDAIDAASTQVTASATYSATRSLLSQFDTAIAAYRSRNRTSPTLRLRILLPDWVKELVRADLARGFRGGDLDPLSVTDDQIQNWFTLRSVNPAFYVDSSTSGGQIFGSQGAGALTAFPSTVVWYLFVEGSFVFLDGGTLDLGLVRDSTLNKTNDYQIFAETFEAVAFYGIESLKVTSTVCPNGSYAPAATGSAPC